MAKKSYVIDINKPAFPFGQEYWPNKAEPVSSGGRVGLTDSITAIDFKNVLPTPYGYSSFFGISRLGGLELPPITEKVFTYSDSLGNNTLIALGKYGAMFSQDGVTWNTTEVDNNLVQVTVGNYKYVTDMTKSYTGFLNCTATVTNRAANLANTTMAELSSNAQNNLGQELIIVPVSPTNTYFASSFITLDFQPEEVFDRLTHYINPNIPEVIAGDVYILAMEGSYGRHVATAVDTVTSVLKELVAQLNIKSGRGNYGQFAEYISDSKIRCYVTSAYSSVYTPPAVFYSVPANVPATASILTLTANGEAQDVPSASIGNLAYIEFQQTSVLTSGTFNLTGESSYWSGFMEGASLAAADIDQTRWGDFTFTTINANLGTRYYFVLDTAVLSLNQWTGATQLGLTATVHDTGIASGYINLGSRNSSALTRIDCGLVQANLTPGRKIVLVSKGQAASYTIVFGNTVSTVLQNLVNAYNAIGPATATYHGDQTITSTSVDPIFCQLSALTTMTDSGVPAETRIINSYSLGYNFVALSTLDNMFALSFLITAAPTNLSYRIYMDGVAVPVTDDLGLWTDSTYTFTSAQVSAAVTAGTKLLVRMTGKHLVIRAINTGAATLGNVSFKFTPITANGAPMCINTGPETNIINMPLLPIVSYMQVYTRELTTNTWRQHKSITTDSGSIHLSPYRSGNRISSGLVLTGLTPDTPTTDIKQFNAALLRNGELLGVLFDTLDKYTPSSLAITYVHPITAVVTSLATGLVRTVLDSWDLSSYSIALSLAEQDTFSIYNPWTMCIIRNRLYCYRNSQGAGTYVLRLLANGTAWEQLIPTFANMAQIEGIAAARGRMVMWDTTGSVYTSSITNPVDFTPSLKTRANVAKVDAVRGNIILCLGYKDGYIIYSTASIILATYVGDTTTFKYTTLSNEQGILNTKAVTVVDDSLQFAYTDAGLYAVSSSGLQEVSPEASEFIKRSAISPKLDYLENRYLSIAFSPETASWTVSRLELYSGQTIASNLYPDTSFITSYQSMAINLTGIYTLTVPTAIIPEQSNKIVFSVQYNHPAILGVTATVKTLTVNPIARNGKSDQELAIEVQREIYRQVVLNAVATTTTVDMFYNGTVYAVPEILAPVTYGATTIQVSKQNLYTALQYMGWYILSLFEEGLLNVVCGNENVDNLSVSLQGLGSKFDAIYSKLASISTSTDSYSCSFVVSPSSGTIVRTLSEWKSDVMLGDSLYNGSLSPAVLTSMTPPSIRFGSGFAIVSQWSGQHIPAALGTAVIGSGTPDLTGLIDSSFNFTLTTNPAASSTDLASILSGGQIPVSSISAPAVIPDIVIPAGQFITTTGTPETIDGIYSKTLLLDTKLKNWGSCDISTRAMIDFTPINAKALNPITGEIGTSFTYQNLAKALAIMAEDGTLSLCTQNTIDSFIEFGDIGFTRTGVTRFLDAIASMPADTVATMEVFGSRDGETLSPILTYSAGSVSGSIHLYRVLTGKWFRLRISGRFNLKQLTFSGELGGKR